MLHCHELIPHQTSRPGIIILLFSYKRNTKLKRKNGGPNKLGLIPNPLSLTTKKKQAREWRQRPDNDVRALVPKPPSTVQLAGQLLAQIPCSLRLITRKRSGPNLARRAWGEFPSGCRQKKRAWLPGPRFWFVPPNRGWSLRETAHPELPHEAETRKQSTNA